MERDLPLNVMFRTEDIWHETSKFGRQVVMRLRDLEGKTEIAFATSHSVIIREKNMRGIVLIDYTSFLLVWNVAYKEEGLRSLS